MADAVGEGQQVEQGGDGAMAGDVAGNAAVEGVVQRPQRKRKRISPFLPPKPRKAASAYSLFLKDFYARNPATQGVGPRDRLRNASLQWRQLSDANKRTFENACAADKARYLREITMWKRQKEFVKRPASSYAIFLRETWNAERGTGRSLTEVGRHASRLWAEMGLEQKNTYKDRYNQLLEEHRQKIENLRNGGPLPGLEPAGEPNVQVAGGGGANQALAFDDDDFFDDDEDFDDEE